MESTLNWEYNSLISELTQGMEKAKQLRFHLYASETLDLRLLDLLLQKVLASYANALAILKRPLGEETKPAEESLSNAQKSSISVENPKTQEANQNSGDHQVDKIPPKKRKMQHIWTEQVQIKPENGLDGPTEDGFNWRKYGQKDILGAKYPRSYYRCTYRLLQNCNAMKQVQRSDDDPTIFFITYKGTHTCNQSNNNAVPIQHGKQELKHECHNHQPQEQNQTLLNLKSNLKVNTTDLDNDVGPHLLCPLTFESHERDNCYYPTSGVVADDSHQSTISSLFYSPRTSESSYFSAETYQMMYERAAPNLQQHSESDIAEMISGHASTTSSPIGGLGFSFDSVELDPNFQFGDLGFYA